MLSNKDIKRKELYKLNQELLKVLGTFKSAQNEFLVAMNQLALDELDKPNALVKGVHGVNFKRACKRYIDTYGRKVGIERQITALKRWEVND